MENIMKQIRVRLEKGESPKELITNGFKRATVYSVAKKIKCQSKNDSHDQSLDRDIYLARLISSAFFTLMLADDPNCDPDEEWDSCVEMAGECFKAAMGREPPTDFRNPPFKDAKST